MHRRSLIVLVVAQVLSGVGLVAGVTVGSLLAQDMLSSTRLAGLPSAVGTAGSMLGAVAVGRMSQIHGRRPGLAAGYLAGAVGSAGVVVAAADDSPVLLFLALFVYGAGLATTLQSRYAGADLAAPSRRARGVSTVLVATALGAVAGPNLAAPAGALAQSLGIPHLAGPFLLAFVAYAMAALVLIIWLRPDPLLLARNLRNEGNPPPSAQPGRADDQPNPETRRSDLLVGTLTIVITQLVMVAVMTMTPIHMHDHGHGSSASGLVIAVHLGAMYLPSPVTGWLVDRYNHRAVAAVSALVLLAAGMVAATAPGGSVAPLTVALALLGLGWNLGFVAGTAIVTEAVPLTTRAKTQGLVDVVIAFAGAGGGMASGLVVATAGYPVLAIGGGILALSIAPLVVIGARGR